MKRRWFPLSPAGGGRGEPPYNTQVNQDGDLPALGGIFAPRMGARRYNPRFDSATTAKCPPGRPRPRPMNWTPAGPNP
ncbi:hypothetical protein Rmet_6412 [Cupriavidus metallidurans CH34]|uniref:Uncharacterized protein n=1 Tax=Cupriavidus metallidurans (strain ATCC 43123 / DSM 2839 / NBRC 102507 / CH34) TaxID=266264 RepID=D3DXL0_CUPMC|nr:hypothetical protein Rmet_6412 [Cupriavidus metallidurans CH34]